MKTLGALFALSLTPALLAQFDPTPVVQGLTQIAVPGGGTGAVAALSGSAAVPLVAGDRDASTPSLFAVASGFGTGRVVAVGHEATLQDAANGTLDTQRFNTQAFDWLAGSGPRSIGYLVGHGEFVGLPPHEVLPMALAAAGWTIQSVPGVVDASALSGFGAILIGNAHGTFTAGETAAIEGYVQNGGGLYLAGLGWSYGASRIDTYPMNLLGERFGVRWTTRVISDPTNSIQGSPILSTFFPNAQIHAPDTALAYVQSLVAQNPSDFDARVRASADVSADLRTAVGVITSYPTFASGPRATFDLAVRQLLQQYPQWFGMAPSFPQVDATLVVVRAALHGAVRTAFPFEGARVAEVTTALDIDNPAISPIYGELLREHDVLILDNRAFTQANFDCVVDHAEIIRGVRRDLEYMSARDDWSSVQTDREYFVPGLGVNIFGSAFIGIQEPQFPTSYTTRTAPLFGTAVVHEIGHVVDSLLSRESAEFAARKAAILAAAGTDDLQFLRGSAQFFQSAPQEFFASICNQWCTASVLTLRLGLQRFQNGFGQPILQALLAADAYSADGQTTPLFDMDTAGRSTSELATLTRDAQGRITGICASSINLQVRYDAAGNVVSVFERAPGCSPSWADLGNGLAGNDGVPQLQGFGDLIASDPMTLLLTDALPSAPAVLVFGGSRIDFPIFGGTLVPNPEVSAPFMTSTFGEFTVNGTWPMLPVGDVRYFQMCVLDAGAVEGLAFSNAVAATTQP